MSKFGVFPAPYFLALRLKIEIYNGESSYSIQRRENTDQKKIQIRTFSRELKCVKYEQINFIFSMINFALLKLYSKLNFFHSTDKS